MSRSTHRRNTIVTVLRQNIVQRGENALDLLMVFVSIYFNAPINYTARHVFFEDRNDEALVRNK